MAHNKLILSTFISQLDECLDDMLKTYPTTATDQRFIKCKMYFDTLKKTNPRTMILAWKKFVNERYREQIDAKNIDFFIHKDYSNDVSDYDNVVEGAINDMRETIMQMSESNKETSMKYVQNLCKLGDLYVI